MITDVPSAPFTTPASSDWLLLRVMIRCPEALTVAPVIETPSVPFVPLIPLVPLVPFVTVNVVVFVSVNVIV